MFAVIVFRASIDDCGYKPLLWCISQCLTLY